MKKANTMYSRIVTRTIAGKNVQYLLLTGFALPLVQRTAQQVETIGNPNMFDQEQHDQRVQCAMETMGASAVQDVTSPGLLKKIAAQL